MTPTITNPMTITIEVPDWTLDRVAELLAEKPDATDLSPVDVATDDEMFDLYSDAVEAIVTTLRVEKVFLALYDDPLFAMHLAAEDDSESVEGSVSADDFLAAKMLRDAAPEGSPLKDVKVFPIHIALQAVMSRYGVSRGEERTRQERLELWAMGVFRRNADGKVELRGVDFDEDDE